jgi:hypothetical protein
MNKFYRLIIVDDFLFGEKVKKLASTVIHGVASDWFNDST